MLPAGIGETEIQFVLHGFVEGGGEALEPGELGVVGCGVGTGEGGGGDEFRGTLARALGGGGDARLAAGASRMVVVSVAAMRHSSSTRGLVSRWARPLMNF